MKRSGEDSCGIIGLGIIGTRVARFLSADRGPVYVWNRSPRPEPNFVASPGEMARLTEVIQIFVNDGPALLEVVRGLAPELTSDHVVVNNCTADPESVVEAYRITRETGAGFLDAPFTGSREAAERGELIYFVGGAADALERARPVLEGSSSEIIPAGRIGEATLLKIASNMVSAATVEILSEALGLIHAAGVDPERFARVFASSACGSELARSKLETMIAGDFDPRFSLKNMFKDAQHALALAKGLSVDLPALSTTANVLYRTMQKGEGERDYSVVAERFLEDRSSDE